MIFAFVSRLFVLVQYVIPKHAISRLTGTLSRLRLSWITHLAIRIFVKAYDVDMGEAAETDVRSYSSFNAFFTRALAPGARPLADEGAAIVSPADGIVSQIGTIDGTCIIQAKGIDYKLMDLFDGDDDLASRFENGSFVTIYLAPRNYHRVHLPLPGRARFLRYVPGTLFSVDHVTTQKIRRLFSRNERVAVVYDTPGGSFSLIMVGALNVGSIELTLPVPTHFANRPQSNYPPQETHELDAGLAAGGSEFGRFNIGSTVILVTSRGLVEWSATASSQLKMGEPIGRLLPPG